MVLSILIATVPGRESLLSRLLWTIEHQLSDKVEVIIYQGWIPFGDKVNQMRGMAKGEYSVVVDDDDFLMPNYMDRVLPLLQDIDYLDYGVLHLHNGKFAEIIHSEDRVHHKCPVRNSLAQQVPLGNGYTDDWGWSRSVHPLVNKKKTLDEAMYIYDFHTDNSVGTEPGKAVVHRDVGIWPYDLDRFNLI